MEKLKEDLAATLQRSNKVTELEREIEHLKKTMANEKDKAGKKGHQEG